MASLVSNSPEYQSLLQQRKDAWKHVRSVTIALHSVASALHGQLDKRYLDEIERSEPLEASAVGYSFNKEFVERWSTALAHLETFADAELPQP